MVQTEARLARGRVRRVLRGTTGFSRRRALVDDAWATVCLWPESFGARREEELASGCEGEKIDC